jgi:histone H3/H4
MIKSRFHQSKYEKFIRKFNNIYFMARGERGIPMAVVERILKQKGEQAGVTRVSDKAIRYLKQELEDIALEIAKGAVSLATHGKRTTVKREDIQLATKQIFKKM